MIIVHSDVSEAKWFGQKLNFILGLLCQFGMMPFLAFGFSNMLTDAQSIAVIIQVGNIFSFSNTESP